jgi:hypothetical protein
LTRLPGVVTIVGYLGFVTALGITVAQNGVLPAAAYVPAAVIAAAGAALLARGAGRPRRSQAIPALTPAERLTVGYGGGDPFEGVARGTVPLTG